MNDYQSCLARSGLYAYISAGFCYPEEGVRAFLSETPLEELESSIRIFPMPAAAELRSSLGQVHRSFGQTPLDVLQKEHRRVFGHTTPRDYSPYETDHGDSLIFRQTNLMGDIGGFYAAFGLQVGEKAHERLDHISVELEFMGFLAYKEAHAAEHHGPEQAALCREAQRKFVREHLGTWVPHFAQLLGNHAGDGLYADLAASAATLVSCDAAHLAVNPVAVAHRAPLRVDSETADFTCGAQCALQDLLSGGGR